MSQMRGGLYALGLLAVVVVRPLHAFITQAILGHSPLNPKE